MTTLPLSKVGIDGFRGLRSLDLDGLGRINILVGNNNSGKTSVLEALSILSQPFNPDEWLNIVRRRDFGQLDETRVQSLRWCFTQTSGLPDPDQLIEAACNLTCEGDFPLRSLNVRYTEFIGEPSPNEIRRGTNITSRIMRHHVDLPLPEETMRGAELTHIPNWSQQTQLNIHPITLKVWEGIIPQRFTRARIASRLDSETLTPYSYQINRNQVRSQSKLIFQQDSPSVLKLLQDFDSDIEGIDLASFRGDRPAIYIKHRKLGVAPLSVFGDAMRRAVLLATTLLSLKDGGLLLIDEVEAGIHVGALVRVFEWLVTSARTLHIQVFVTTHSLEALDALVSARPLLGEEDIVAFHLTQTAERTLGKRLYGDLLRRLRFERGLDVR
ncbi:MAG: AAA family ATPase [Candidatus Methylumidiphilus sp.]